MPNTNTNTYNTTFSIREAAAYCGFSVSTLNRLRNIQDFPKALQISIRRIGFLKNEIDEWLRTRKRSIVGDLSEHREKIRCPQTPQHLEQIRQEHIRAKLAS